MISALAQPGSEQNPLRPDSGVRSLDEGLQQYVEENRPSAGISIPRALDDGGMFEGLGDGGGGDAVFALSTVVSRDGRVAIYQVLSEPGGRSSGRTARQQDHVDAVLAAGVRQSRFAPAQTPGGSKVAVNMIWLIDATTVVKPVAASGIVHLRESVPERAPEPVVVPAAAPKAGSEQLSSALPSATA
jgi:hypothetical protein